MYAYALQEAYGLTETLMKIITCPCTGLQDLGEIKSPQYVVVAQIMMQATEMITQSSWSVTYLRALWDPCKYEIRLAMDVVVLFSAPVLVGLLVLMCLAYVYYR